MRLLAALVGLVAVAGSALSFSAASAEDVVGLTVETFTDKSNYTLGEPVSVTVVVTNAGTEPIELTFSSTMQAYYRVMASDGVKVYDYNAHHPVFMAFTRLYLEPGKSTAYVFDDSNAWLQVDNRDNPLPAGTYRILGVLAALELEESQSVAETEVALGYEDDFIVDVFVEVDLEKLVYDPGEPVNVTVVVTNRGIYDRRIWYSSYLTAYYVVEDSQGTTVFDLRSHVDVSASDAYCLPLRPGQTHHYEFNGTDAWEQVDDSGQPVGAGESYVIRGYLNTSSPCEDGSATSFTISEDDTWGRFLSDPVVVTVVIVVAAACILTIAFMALFRRGGKVGKPGAGSDEDTQ